MWIKRNSDIEVVNLDFVQSIRKNANAGANSNEFYIKFFQRNGNYVIFNFDNEKELNKYFDALMNFMNVQEIPLLKVDDAF